MYIIRGSETDWINRPPSLTKISDGGLGTSGKKLGDGVDSGYLSVDDRTLKGCVDTVVELLRLEERVRKIALGSFVIFFGWW